MGISKTIEVINAMEADGVIGRYAIAGAVAAYNYIEPMLTEGMDVLVSFDDDRDSKIPALERSIEGRPVEFLPVSNLLDLEAIADTEQVEFRNESGDPVRARVLKPEYLVAICLRAGRPKDLICISQFLEERAVDVSALWDVLARHGLRSAWEDFCARFRVDDRCSTTDVRMAGEKAPGYPDISDVLERKAEIRRHLAKRSFEEKVDAMEALRERLRPFKEAREKRKAERELKKN